MNVTFSCMGLVHSLMSIHGACSRTLMKRSCVALMRAHIMGMTFMREEIVDRELIGNEESLKQEVSLVGKAVILHITDREFESPTSYPHTHYLSASLMRHILPHECQR